ncbi:hypothetical protein GCM10009618_06680 [Nesterenkonia lacusekhoensis]
MAARAQDGDVAAFEQLLDIYEAPLLRLAVRMLRVRFDAEDVVQDTFLTVWRRVDTLEDAGRFKTWIYRLVSNACIDVVRRRERQRTNSMAPRTSWMSRPGHRLWKRRRNAEQLCATWRTC